MFSNRAIGKVRPISAKDQTHAFRNYSRHNLKSHDKRNWSGFPHVREPCGGLNCSTRIRSIRSTYICQASPPPVVDESLICGLTPR